MHTLVSDPPNWLVELRSGDGSLCYHTGADKDDCVSFAAEHQRSGDEIRYYQRQDSPLGPVRWYPVS